MFGNFSAHWSRRSHHAEASTFSTPLKAVLNVWLCHALEGCSVCAEIEISAHFGKRDFDVSLDEDDVLPFNNDDGSVPWRNW